MVFFLVRSFAAYARLGPSANRRCTESTQKKAARPVTQQMRKRTTKKQKNAQELQRLRKKTQKVRAFYKKITKNHKKCAFFCRKSVPNLPICDMQNNKYDAKTPKYYLRYATHERNGFIKTPGTRKSSKPRPPKKTNHRPTARNKTKTSKKLAKSSAALRIRSFCVRGSTNFHTKPQTAITIQNRRTNKTTLTSILKYYLF